MKNSRHLSAADLSALCARDFRRRFRGSSLRTPIEPLESRRLLASVTVVSSVLTVNADSGNDTINIDPSGSTQTKVTLNGAISTFNNSAFTAIKVSGNNGNDKITINNSITKPATLLGGAGNDSLTGGGGNDVLDGQAGADTMKGGSGNDTADYHTRTAPLTIGIGSLNDDGEAGEKDNVYLDIETVLGGSGNDKLNGYSTNNLLVGNGGNDSITGNFGNDTLSGDAGTDTLNGEGGTDTAINASGDTLISIEIGGGAPSTGATMDANGNLVVTGTNGPDSISVSIDNEDLVFVTINGSGDSFDARSFRTLQVNALGGNDTINYTFKAVSFMSSGDPTLNGGDGNDTFNFSTDLQPFSATIIGGAGDDVFSNTEAAPPDSNFLFDGGDGIDTLNLINVDLDLRTMPSVENATIAGGTLIGTDQNNVLSLLGSGTIQGMGGNDTIHAGDDGASLEGGAGDDSLTGGSGNDTLDGGAGADLMKGGAGNDTVDYSSRTNPVSVGPGTLADDGEANEHDNIATDIETILGGSGNDTLKGTADDNLIVGNGGNDSILANFGNDTLSGNAGTDTLNGEGGTDTAINSGGDTLISIEKTGGAGDAGTVAVSSRVLIVTGTDNADIITFSPTGDTIGIGISSNGSAIASADILYSQFDSIQIHAGGGNDNVVIDQNGQLSQSITIDLNEGNDHVSLDHIGSVTVSGGDGNDSIDAQESGYAFNGDAGIDTINDFHFDPFGMNLQNTPTTENAHIRLGTLTGNALDNDLSTQLSKTGSPMSGLGGNDTLTVGEETPYGISDVDGGDGDDLINGGSGELIGGNGNDTINGGSFSEGGAGNDSLVGGLSMDGGDDNDTLIGQSRDEALFGGNGNDSLDGGEGNDTLDGGLGADILKGGTGLDTLDYSSRTNPVSIGPGSLADDGEANEHDNVATDIETLIGGEGNDLIKGTADNNLLIGNGGNDSILGNFGNDTLSGNAGTDTLNGENGDDTAINSAGDQLISIEHAT